MKKAVKKSKLLGMQMTISRFFYLLFYDEDKAREKYMELIQKKQTLNPFDQVLVRDCLDDTWKPDIFLHLNPTVEYKYECTTGCYRYCIPYQEFNSLNGTSLEPFQTFQKGDIVAVTHNGETVPCVYNSFDESQNLHSVTIKGVQSLQEKVYPFNQIFEKRN